MHAKDGRVVPNFINQALNGKDITVYGDGSQTRSFCYVSDLIEEIFRLMISDFCEPLNLGNPEELSVLEFAKIIIGLTGSNSQIIHEALPLDDPKVRSPDITRAKEILGWNPKVGLREGFEKTIEYFAKDIEG
jgi:dTDP-glucose 4,6-dehydratase